MEGKGHWALWRVLGTRGGCRALVEYLQCTSEGYRVLVEGTGY